MKRKVKEMPGVIIVTGGAEGIGAEICQGLAADGLKVVVADYAKDAAEMTIAPVSACVRPRLLMMAIVSGQIQSELAPIF